MTGILICDDLIFTSKVTATARAKGATVTAVRTSEAAVKAAASSPPACVIVDLHNPGLVDVTALLKGLRDACPTMPRVVAFGSHVDVSRLQSAREAGCDLVMPRSKFVAQLEEKLAEWCGVSH